MIQRIQSIFLLLASLAAFSLFLLPFADIMDFTGETGSFTLFRDKVFDLNDNIILMILTVLGGVLSFAAIFLFNNRTLQMRLGLGVIICAILLLCTGGFLYYQEFQQVEQVATRNMEIPIDVEYGILSPMVMILFAGLANRFIKKDENLVKSMDRLR